MQNSRQELERLRIRLQPYPIYCGKPLKSQVTEFPIPVSRVFICGFARSWFLLPVGIGAEPDGFRELFLGVAPSD